MKTSVRRAGPEDYPLLCSVWLEASIAAHDFVEPEFWKSKAADMRDIYLPASETWLIEKNGIPVGFFSLVDNVLAALFVDPSEQGRGIGSSLIEKARKIRPALELTVYKDNLRAVSFYEMHGFSITEERRDSHTSHQEYVMKWRKLSG